MRFKLLFLGLIIAGGLLAAGQARAAGLLCLPPTPLQPIVNKLTGEVTLWWQPQMAVTSYIIEVYAPNSLTPLKSYTVDGKFTTFVVPNDDLACGNYQYRVKAECCDERCDKCETDKRWDSNRNYCSNMAELWNTPCGCTDVNYPTGVQYSFHFMCSDGSYAGWVCPDRSLPKGGVCADGLPPQYVYNCPLGEMILGCNWECSPTTHYEPKVCGSDYEVACGQGPNKQLVSDTPSYNLCSIKEPSGWRFDDKYLRKPPGVTEEQPPLLYQWMCGAGLKVSDQCLACRRAECGAPYGKVYAGSLPESQLCLGADGKPTGQLLNLVETDEGWTWDCQGRTECGDNKNFVKIDKQWQPVEKCQAAKASCGQANAKFYTSGNFKDKANGVGFLCPAKGRAEGILTPGRRYDEILFTDATDKNLSNKVVSHTFNWRCVFDQTEGQPVAIECEARGVGCDEAAGADYTRSSFDALKSALPSPAGFCHNGLGTDPNETQVTVSTPQDRTTPPGWTWNCADLYGGQEECQAALVDCKKPPHQGEYKDKEEVLAQAPLCTAGTATTLFDVLDGSVLTGWFWTCQDDFGSQELCSATLFKCLAPPNQGIYANWQDLIAKTGASCSGTDKDATRTCDSVCSNKASKVAVTYSNKKWTWSCGNDKCSADKETCQEPPHNGFYGEWADLERELAASGGSCGKVIDANNRLCVGVCNNKDTEVQVTYNPVVHQFTWTCGGDKCESKKMGCGELVGGESPLLYTDFNKYKTSPDPYSLCLNDGQAVWYNEYQGYNKYEDGFTPWGVGEWSVGNPFVDHDRADAKYKEGSWLWQCKYGGKVIPTTSKGGQFVYEKNNTFYCYAYEKGVCGDVLQYKDANKNRFTLEQIKAMAADDQVRGNNSQPPLCDRGIVFKGNDIDGSPLDDGFRCFGGTVGSKLPQDHCRYFCENGMLKGAQSCDNIDVTGCAKPPYGESYQDKNAFYAVFKDWETSGTDGCEKFNDGRTLASTDRQWNPDTCQWTWKCGGMGCYADKIISDLTATVSGPQLPAACSDNSSDVQTLTAVTNCQADNPVITWTIKSPSGKIITDTTSGKTYSFTAQTLSDAFQPAETGDYTFSYHIFCPDKCFTSQEADSNIVKFNVKAAFEPAFNIKGPDSFCSSAPSAYGIEFLPNQACSKYTITWELQGQMKRDTKQGNQSDSSYTPPKDWPAGAYTLTATVDCSSESCANPKVVTVSRNITINKKEVAVSVAGDKEFCSENNLFFRATDLTNPLCQNPAYRWFIDGKEVTDRDNDDTTLTIAPPYTPVPYQEGEHNVTVELTCNDPDTCEPKTVMSAPFVFNIGATKQPEVPEISADPNNSPCEGQSQNYFIDTGAIKDCTDYTLTWSLTNSLGVQVNKLYDDGFNNLPSYDTWENLGAGTYNLTLTFVCQDLCASHDPIYKYQQVVVEASKILDVGLTMSEAENDNAVCQGENLDFVASDLTTPQPCNNPTYDWEVDGAPVAGVHGVNFSISTLAAGEHTVTVTMRCDNDKCKDFDSVSEEIKFMVYDCTCGTASGQNFVDINKRSNGPKSFDLCNAGGTPINEPPDLDQGGMPKQWRWKCQYGSNPGKTVDGCLASKVECGTNAGAKHVLNVWQTLPGDFCTAGSTVGKAALDLDQPEVDDPDNYYNINDTYNWNCRDSANYEIEGGCSGDIVDCGIADANRVLNHPTSDQRIRPELNGIFRGSYDGDYLIRQSHGCVNYNLPDVTDTGRGKFVWSCLGDNQDAADSVSCEARKDCGWIGSYTTVQYDNAGCWTAENITDAAGNNSFNWGTALRIAQSGGDSNACAPTPLWSACSKLHCPSQLGNTCNQKGLCPGNWKVPEDWEWHSLESKLANGNNCDGTRFDAWDCQPAGATNKSGWQEDGLQDQVAFAGNADGYWTRSSGSQLRGNGCPPPSNNPFYARSLFNYVLGGNGEQVNRLGDLGNCSTATATSNQLRCVGPGTTGSVRKSDCVGWGCWESLN